MNAKLQAQKVEKILEKEFPTVDTPLIHKNAFELLIGVMLSPQTLDTTTNKVTPALFAQYPNAFELAKADPLEIEPIIRLVNYHKTKSKNLVKAANILIEKFNGEVPRTMEELILLPGVGRKVANVVISEWFARHEGAEPEGFVVDTHVLRTSYRLGTTKNTNATKVEQDLMKAYSKDKWVDASLRLIFHGRKTCKSQSPLCSKCPLQDICPKRGVKNSI